MLSTTLRIMTDGFALARPLPCEQLSAVLGGLQLDGYGPAVVASENCWTHRVDGASRIITPFAWGADLFDLFKRRPRERAFVVPQAERVTIAAGVQLQAPELIGRERLYAVEYRVNGLTRRWYPDVVAGDLAERAYRGLSTAVSALPEPGGVLE